MIRQLRIVSLLIFPAVVSNVIEIAMDGPRNTAVGLGDTLRLSCPSKDYSGIFVWSEYTYGVEQILATNTVPETSHPWYGSFNVTSDNDLVIPEISYNKGGRYECSFRLWDRDVFRRYAEVIIVSQPECFFDNRNPILVENVNNRIGCTLQYMGKWGPTLEWHEGDQVLNSTLDTADGPSKLYSSIVPHWEQDGGVYVCQIAFPSPTPDDVPPSEENSDATPSYRNQCTLNITVLYSARIEAILGFNDSVQQYRLGSVFECDARGNPAPDVKWLRETGPGAALVEGRRLYLMKSMLGDNTYTCLANNSVNGDVAVVNRTITFTVVMEINIPTEPPTPPPTTDDFNYSVGIIVGSVSGSLLILALVILVLYVIIKRQNVTGCAPAKPMTKWKRDRRPSSDLLQQTNSNELQFRPSNNYTRSPTDSTQATPMQAQDNKAYEADEDEADLREGIPAWEVERKQIILDKVLGEGHFGVVYKARVFGMKKRGDGINKAKVVAIKTLKNNASDKDKVDLINELEVMRLLPEHDNVLKLLGCCTTRDPVYVIVEYVANGNLRDFVRLKRTCHLYGNVDPGSADDHGAKELITFALQIARGMSHISHHQLLHRDLAARNILVSKHKVCKVSDFGLARDIIDRNEYTRESAGPLPIRWMAPESIYMDLYTTKSDVWSYGILLWEIVTLGASPYPGMAPKQVIQQVRDGYRMEKPKHCTDEIGYVMQKCWNGEAELRPSFADIVNELDSLLLAESDYLALELYQEEIYGDLQPSEEEKV